MTQKPHKPDIGPFLENFSRFESPLQPSWLLPLRKAGITRFMDLGFPTLQDEDWRFTNLAPLAKLPLQPASEPANDDAARAALKKHIFTPLPGPRLIFVNGQYSMALSSVHGLPDGVRVSNLMAALVADSESIKKQLGQCALTEDNAFAALNQAFFTDGGFIHVPAGVSVADPIQFIFISTAKQAGETIQPRNLIIAGANSRATVVESYISTDDTAYFTNAVTEIVAGDNAALEHVKFQDEADAAFHLATIAGQFGRASNVSVHSFALGAKLSRNNIRTKLAGEGLECILNGLYLTRGEQLADHHMIVEHAQPHCASHEYFNGILDDKSQGRLSRADPRPANRAEDRRQADEQKSAALRRRDRRHQAATGDLRRRREMHARRDHRPVERRIHFLPALARHRRGHCAADVDSRLRRRNHRAHEARAVREELDKLVWDRLEANQHLAQKN